MACNKIGVELNDNTIMYKSLLTADQVVIVQNKENLELMEIKLFK